MYEMYVCMKCMYLCRCVSTSTYAYMYVCMYVCSMYVCIYKCIMGVLWRLSFISFPSQMITSQL